MLYNILNWADEDNLKHKGKQIPIIRADFNVDKFELEQQGIYISKSSLPVVYFYHKDKYYHYEENFQANFFLHFINRHLYPIVLLKTKEDIESFINTTSEWEENTPFSNLPISDYFKEFQMVTRIIAFVWDKTEYKSELKDLRDAAISSAERNDLRIAKVTDKKLIKYYKQLKDKEWFEELSSNSVVIFKNTENIQKVEYLNLDIDTVPIFEYINKASLAPIPILNAFTTKIHRILNYPLFIAFVDINDIYTAEQSRYLLKNLKSIESAFPTVVLSRLEGNQDISKRKDMGIEGEEIPAFAYSNSGFGDQCAFPRQYPMTQKNLIHFIRSCIMGKYKREVELPDKFQNTKIEDL
mmetsp:Transcript_15569/g.13608  ORF Transcript_15569/g.13608 Transcript_15569/m.13608 type:complete len:354 (+) Transcript_15569:298-1359(+)